MQKIYSTNPIDIKTIHIKAKKIEKRKQRKLNGKNRTRSLCKHINNCPNLSIIILN